MDRTAILMSLKNTLNNIKFVLKETKFADDIGYKKLFEEVVPLGEYMLANDHYFPDYELYSFMKLCSCAKEVRNPQRDIDLRRHELELLFGLADQQKMFLSLLYGYRVEKANAVTAEEPAKDATVVASEPVKEVTGAVPNVQHEKLVSSETQGASKVITLNDFVMKNDLEVLQKEIEWCSSCYNMNRTRLDSLGFSSREEELYSIVASWGGKASDLTKNLIKDGSVVASDYCSKFLRNATALTKMMSWALESQDAFSLKSRIQALEGNLVKMQEYYSEPLKKIN